MKSLTLYRPRDLSTNILENAFGGFDRYLDAFFGDNFLSPADRIFSKVTLPSVDVRETEKAYIIEAELPGFNEKDIEIKLDGKNLSIKSINIETAGETDSKEEKKDNYLIRERRSSFSRSFILPENADYEGINAGFKDGILILQINKKEDAKTRFIEINK